MGGDRLRLGRMRSVDEKSGLEEIGKKDSTRVIPGVWAGRRGWIGCATKSGAGKRIRGGGKRKFGRRKKREVDHLK